MIKRWLVCLGVIASVCSETLAADWLTDLPAALSRAKQEDKAILLDFTGSDWCGWCKKLKAEVFDQPAFDNYANANLILVEVDFPRHKVLAADQRKANEALAAKYRVEGYPTIVLLNPDGQLIGQTGYQPGGPEAFIASIDGCVHRSHLQAAKTPTPAADSRANVPAPSPVAALAVPTAPVQYGDLKLKGISGTGDHRFVLVNNSTLMLGETGRVKSHDTNVEVTVEEIRGELAVISVGGKKMELKLAEHR